VAFETEDLLIPISVPGPAEPRMADFLRAISEIGSRLWLIGDIPGANTDEETATLFARPGWSHFSLGDLSALPEELTPMLAALPVQLMAEFLAAARGTNADSFRADQEAYKRAGTRFRL